MIRRARSWIVDRFFGGEDRIAFGGKDWEKHERNAKSRKRRD
jgi:hypothetical protein